MWIYALCLRARSGRWADCAPASARADALFRHWHGLRRKAFPCSGPGVYGAPYVRQTPRHAPLTRVTVRHASDASRLERGERALSISPFIRTHALSKARARVGAFFWRSRLRSNPSEPRSLRQAEQVAVRASETAVRGAQDQRRSARNRDSRGAERVGCSCMRYGADTMARLP